MNAVVTGAGRGFGRAVATALVTAGTEVVGIARTAADLESLHHELGDAFVPLPADATDEAVAEQVVADRKPGLLVLNAGATPHLAGLADQTWDAFRAPWETDVHHAFAWLRAALRVPMSPGGVVVAVSSGAALAGSPLSGGYAGAKATIRFLTGYARDEAQRAGLDLRFHALLPQLTPRTGLGALAVEGYAARQGVDPATFAAGLEPVLAPEQIAATVLAIAGDPGAAAEYRVGGAGASVLG
ncbi:SDR family oxidoreductase [Actinomycetospora chlora]|uniref:SDR family oxidoreductase n=1 Tax=Actinomycetospora chlora TaxID=663608 RepID=A0ABP9A8U4_9PSEU